MGECESDTGDDGHGGEGEEEPFEDEVVGAESDDGVEIGWIVGHPGEPAAGGEVAPFRGEVDGSVTVAAADLWVRSGGEERIDGGVIARHGRMVQRGEAVVVRLVDVGMAFDEVLNEVDAPVRDRLHERCRPIDPHLRCTVGDEWFEIRPGAAECGEGVDGERCVITRDPHPRPRGIDHHGDRTRLGERHHALAGSVAPFEQDRPGSVRVEVDVVRPHRRKLGAGSGHHGEPGPTPAATHPLHRHGRHRFC